MKNGFWILVVASVFFGFMAPHAFHVSVTEIKHNPVEKTLEISTNLFTEDIETALRKDYKEKVEVLAPRDSVKTHQLLEKYFRKHLQLTHKDKKLEFEFLGFEKISDRIWCYMEVRQAESPDPPCVINTLLFEHIKEQTNMIHFTNSAGRKSIRLDNPDSRTCFEK